MKPNQAIPIVTKGILGGVPGTKGFIILGISETPIRSRKGAVTTDIGVKRRRLKKVRINFIYNEKEYVEEKIVDLDTKITSDNIEIEVINNKPKIKFIL